MSNHKRKRPKNRRSGCLMCKSWKINGFGKDNPGWEKFNDHKRRQFAKLDIENALIAQRIERLPSKQIVSGSNPDEGADLGM